MTDMHTYFNLSYSDYLVIDPRDLAGSAGARRELSRMVIQLWAAFPDIAPCERVAQLGDEREFGDLTEAEMLQLDITTNLEFLHDGCACGSEPQQGDSEPDDDFCARYNRWDEQRWEHERDDQLWYYRGGEYERDDWAVFATEPLAKARAAHREVLPRTLLQSMPVDWQERFVELHRAVGGQTVTYQVRVFDAVGREIDEPVPHYNRGRTRLEPYLEALT